MSSTLSKIEILVAKWLARRVVKQGGHKQRITALYAIIDEAAEEEFIEDNFVTLKSLLRECFEDVDAQHKASKLQQTHV